MPQDLLRNGGAARERDHRLALRYTGDRFWRKTLPRKHSCAPLPGCRATTGAGRPPWLFRIALNLCRNCLRSAREIPVGERAISGKANPEAEPEQAYLQQETEQELAAALQALPPIYREVLILKHVNELSYAEISAILGLNLSLVKNRLYRGRIMLRQALQKGECKR